MPIAIVLCDAHGGLTPLPLRRLPLEPPRGIGCDAVLVPGERRRLAREVRAYIEAVARSQGLRIARIAIDGPRDYAPPDTGRRRSEAALAAAGIRCFPTPTRAAFEAKVPPTFQVWMPFAFALFEALGTLAECLETYPHAVLRALGGSVVPPPADACWGAPHDRLDAYLCAWVASLGPRRRRAYGDPSSGDAIWVPR